MATAVVSFQWFFWGYSLAFSHTAGKFIGDLENIGFRNVLAAPSVGSSKIPDLLFAVYQGMFAAITVALAVGAVAERGRMVRFTFLTYFLSALAAVLSRSPASFALFEQFANSFLSFPQLSSCSSGQP